MTTAHRILLSRLLTRSGDQAWSFAVPLVLIQLFPSKLQIVAAYYFLIQLAQVFILPPLAALIDRVNRWQAARIGVYLQVLCALTCAVVIANGYETLSQGSGDLWLVLFGLLVVLGIGSALGATFMDISVGSDLAPSAIAKEDLSIFNSRMRQIDLFTEVTSPLLAGAVLLITTVQTPLLGFYLIAAWNLVSFFPELALLKSVFKRQPDLLKQTVHPSHAKRLPLLRQLTLGWKTFWQDPVAPAVSCYALLWLSVLSPHGVLLTGYLKGAWNLPEFEIGVFRGLGAIFGLIATLIFPWAVSKMGLLRASRRFLLFQAVMVGSAVLLFWLGDRWGQLGFLALILFSRVGLYGFSLGETQIRQIAIRPELRGQINGVATALTSVATLGLYGAGAILPSTQDFPSLILLSGLFVSLGAIGFALWTHRYEKMGLSKIP